MQATITVDGEPVREVAHGHADVEQDVVLTPRHLFRIASHSKTFTATAIMQLVHDGRLRLDDRASTHLSWLAGGPLVTATLADLLSHSAGVIRDGRHADWWQLSYAFPDATQLRRIATEDPSLLQTSERFKYSNIGYGLLGAVIEAVTARPYQDVVRDGIIDRLGLRDTAPEWWPERAQDHAVGYSGLGYAARRRPIEHVDTRALAAATGFASTASDLSRYFAAHVFGDERLLDDESKRRMQHAAWEVPRGQGKKPGHYGLGLDLAELDDVQLVGHGGGYPGHSTRSHVDPHGGVSVSVFVNCIDGPAGALADGVVRLIAAAGADVAADETVDEDVDRFTGRFANLWGVIDVVRVGRRLLLIDPADDDPMAAPSVAVPDGPEQLRVVDSTGSGGYRETMTYSFAADGRVRSISGPSGMTYHPIDVMTELIDSTPRIVAGTVPGET